MATTEKTRERRRTPEEARRYYESQTKGGTEIKLKNGEWMDATEAVKNFDKLKKQGLL